MRTLEYGLHYMPYPFISCFGGDKGNGDEKRKIMEYGDARMLLLLVVCWRIFVKSPKGHEILNCESNERA